MPAMANLVVKDNDGTTNVTYSMISASGGDKSPALWRNTAVGVAPGFNPWVTLVAAYNGPKDRRNSNAEYRFPTTATDSSGKVRVTDNVILKLSVSVPLDCPQTTVDGAVAQGLNLFAGMKTGIQGGFSYT